MSCLRDHKNFSMYRFTQKSNYKKKYLKRLKLGGIYFIKAEECGLNKMKLNKVV